jgi:hypothetical protein
MYEKTAAIQYQYFTKAELHPSVENQDLQYVNYKNYVFMAMCPEKS